MLAEAYEAPVGTNDAWRPMSEALKTRVPVLALMHRNIAGLFPQHGHLHALAGCQIVVYHPGLEPDGYDVGWIMAGPVGKGGWKDHHFEGWRPIEDTGWRAPSMG
jgi:hypothetical protein